MAKDIVDKLARDLARLMTDLIELYGEMAMHMSNKLAAIKRADSDQIQSVTAREMLLADRAAEREGLRRQITQRLVAGLGLDREKSIRIPELAEHFPEPRRSQLLVAAAGLREKLEEVERKRVTTTLITQEMLKHLSVVLSTMTSGVQNSEVYSRSGQRERSVNAYVFEAVG